MELNKTEKFLFKQLMTLNDPGQIKKKLDDICQKAKNGEQNFKFLLGDYAWYGQSPSCTEYALRLLAETVEFSEHKYLNYFQRYIDLLQSPFYQRLCAQAKCGASKPVEAELEAYFSQILTDINMMISHSFLGYLKIKGQDAYSFIVAVIINSSYPFIIRIHAKESLLKQSNNAFLVHTKQDWSGWKPENIKNVWQLQLKDDEWRLPVKAIKKWAKDGFPQPHLKKVEFIKRDPSLDDPKTPLEKLCSRLEKSINVTVLEPNQALAFSNADKNDIAELQVMHLLETEWKPQFPSLYLEFLERFSPHCRFLIWPDKQNQVLNVDEEGEDMREDYWVKLANAGDFINYQQGFGIVHGDYNPQWPSYHIVIGELESDYSSGPAVFIMDLSKSNGLDAPIFLNIHDGPEEILIADSFHDFLEQLASKKDMSSLIKKLVE